MIRIEQFKDTIYEKEEKNTPNYFGILPANVRYDKKLKPMEKILYTEITALSNSKGYCYATNSYFANLYDVHKNTAGTWINNLEKLGYIKSRIIYETGTKNVKERQLFIVTPINKNVARYQQKDCDPINEKIDTPINEKIEDNNTRYNNTRYNNKKINKKETQKDTHVKNNIDIALEKVNAISNDKLNIIFLQNNITSLILKLFDELGTDKTIETLENIKENNFIMKTWKNNYSKEEMFISKILKLETFIKISCGMYDETKNIDISVIQSDEELLKKYDF